MFKKVVIILCLILAILGGLFFTLKKFAEYFQQNNPQPGMVVTTTTVTYDTVPFYNLIPVPVPVDQQPIAKDSTIDTSLVIEDYYTERTYSFDSSDSLFTKKISFKVKKNAVFDYSELFSVVSKTTMITNDIYHYPAFTIGLGGEIGYSRAFNSPTFELGSMLTINNSTFKLGYEFLHKEIKAGYFYNFSFQKSNGKYKLLQKLESKIVL